VDVKDNLRGVPQKDDLLWFQDGLQLLIDPVRAGGQKQGKLDLAIGVGINGPKAWCHLSADASIMTGEAKDISVAAKFADETSGNVTYEIAIPWKRLTPFKPEPGANIGMTIAVNEDDRTPGRDSFMTWFGSVQTKDVAQVGDIILQDE
jgi:hypothetical protein